MDHVTDLFLYWQSFGMTPVSSSGPMMRVNCSTSGSLYKTGKVHNWIWRILIFWSNYYFTESSHLTSRWLLFENLLLNTLSKSRDKTQASSPMPGFGSDSDASMSSGSSSNSSLSIGSSSEDEQVEMNTYHNIVSTRPGYQPRHPRSTEKRGSCYYVMVC